MYANFFLLFICCSYLSIKKYHQVFWILILKENFESNETVESDTFSDNEMLWTCTSTSFLIGTRLIGICKYYQEL